MSFTTAVRSLTRSTVKKFPGADAADIQAYTNLVYAAAIANHRQDFKDTDAIAVADGQLVEAADNGEQWAVNLRDSFLLNVVKPTVDKAVSKGVDPVQALVFQDGLTKEKAAEYIAVLADRASTPEPDSSTPEPDSSDADADDLDAGFDELDNQPVGASS